VPYLKVRYLYNVSGNLRPLQSVSVLKDIEGYAGYDKEANQQNKRKKS